MVQRIKLSFWMHIYFERFFFIFVFPCVLQPSPWSIFREFQIHGLHFIWHFLVYGWNRFCSCLPFLFLSILICIFPFVLTLPFRNFRHFPWHCSSFIVIVVLVSSSSFFLQLLSSCRRQNEKDLSCWWMCVYSNAANPKTNGWIVKSTNRQPALR